MPVGFTTEVCYNVQTAVDAKHKLIVEHEVTNAVTDREQLAEDGDESETDPRS